MADLPISGLPPATALALADLIELEQGTDPSNESVHGTLGQLRALMQTAPVNVQTGTAYTLAIDDAFRLVAMDNASANAITVPPNSAVAFPIGTRTDIGQDGAGQTSVVEGSGVTIRTPETLKLRKRWAKATLIKRDTNTWDIEGNLEAAP